MQRLVDYYINCQITHTQSYNRSNYNIADMPEHKALVLPEKQGSFVIQSVPTRKPGPGELLIKVESVGVAPFDWEVQAIGIIIEKYPAIMGEDITGTVEEVGEGITKFKKGDRV